MSQLLKDLRYGLRMLRKRPGTSILAVLALSLGIGLTTTMFSIVDAAFVRGLPFEHPQDIVALSRMRAGQQRGGSVPPHDLIDWRASQHSFEDLAAMSTFAANVSSEGDLPERYRGASITPNLLRLLRAQPIIGRDFTEADSQPGAPSVAIISFNIWARRYQRSDTALGRTMRINGVPATIVGVMPAHFGFPQTEDLWQPLRLTLPAKRGEGQFVDVIARLKPGVRMTAAQAEMTGLAAQLARQYAENKDITADVQPYVRRFIGAGPIATLSTMLGAVFGVLLIACVNVTNLQLARAAERVKEMAVRVAIGATRRQIVQQLLVEGLLLAAAGAALGLGIASVGMAWFNQAIADTNPPFWIVARVDGRIMAFVTGLTVLVAIASSLVPALRVSKQGLSDVLKDEGRSSTGLRVGAFSRVLVVVEMTLSFVLLVVSGLMIKSVIATGTIAYPFATDVLVARSNLNSADYPTDAVVQQVTDRLRERIAATPGIRRAAVATGLPNGAGSDALTIEGRPVPAESQRPSVRRVDVSPGFFDVLRIRVQEGRVFNEADGPDAVPVAVVTEDFVHKYFPKGGALGARIQLGAPPKGAVDGLSVTIVGTVPSVAVAPQPTDVTEVVYRPLAQRVSRDVTFFADTGGGSPTRLGPDVRRAVMQVDANLPLFGVNSLQGQFDQSAWPFRVFGSLFMTFGLASLLMAAAGLYGVMSFAVRRRTQEIGVRMALGADRRGIMRMIVRQGIWQVAVGMLVGGGLAGWLGGLLQLLLFQVKPWDPVVFAVTIGVLSSAGLLACIVPALRAASVDPLVALRHD